MEAAIICNWYKFRLFMIDGTKEKEITQDHQDNINHPHHTAGIGAMHGLVS